MHWIVLITLTLACFVEYAAKQLQFPPIVRFIPDMISVPIVIYIAAAGIRSGFRLMPPKYWLAFGALALVAISGVLANDVGTGPTISGMRYYLRAIPFFFVPAVADFSEQQIRFQFKYLLGLSLAQFPFAVFERAMVMRSGRSSGDSVVGTLSQSGILSIFLVCAALLVTALLLRHKIRWKPYLTIFLLLLLPTTINETKVTAIIAPIGFFVLAVYGSAPGKRLRVISSVTMLLVLFAAIFIPVYNKLQENSPTRKNIVDFFSDPRQLNRYMSPKAAQLGTTQPVGRTDAYVVPFKYIAQTPVHFTLGLGLGNVTHSEIAENFSGRYYDIFKPFLETSFTIFLLELGTLGVGLVLLLFWMVYKDVLAISKRDSGAMGALALGWIPVIAVMVVSTLYLNIHAFESLSYVYWYLAGLFVAYRAKLEASTGRHTIRHI